MDSRFRVATATSTLVAGALIVIAATLAISAAGVDIDLLAEPENLITLGTEGADVFRWSWLVAIFGYHILLLPVILYLRRRPGTHTPKPTETYTVVGLGYVLVGAIGLAVMMAALPPMTTAWSTAAESEQASLEAIFKVVTDLTFFGLTPLTLVLGGVWWLGIGQDLRAPALGLVTMILGVGTLASGIGFLFVAEALARLELVNYLLAPVWAVWVGWVVFRSQDDVVAVVV